jgi:dsRNA-specific ribonuclease
MDDPTIRLSPAADNKSGATVWKWEILLRGKPVASGTSSGSQESAYTAAREALLKYRDKKSGA